MAIVNIVLVLALLEYLYFGYAVGGARGRHGVDAPTMTGHPVFERYVRVQANTLELLIAFVPGLWMFAFYVHPLWAAGFGAVFIVGRILYFRGYIADPAKRSTGFLLSFAPVAILLIGGLVGAVRAALG
jgi:glutathione S-transferase